MAKKDTKVETVNDQITVKHDDLISHIEGRMAEEYARASDAGESGALVRTFLDETGLNSQAYSWAKSILKKLPKKDGQAKAMDVIRSLNFILPMVENHVVGQGTSEMALDKPTADVKSPEEELDAPAEAEEFGEATEGDDVTDADFGEEPETGDADLDADAEEFGENVADLEEGENVTPFERKEESA